MPGIGIADCIVFYHVVFVCRGVCILVCESEMDTAPTIKTDTTPLTNRHVPFIF